MHAIVDGPAATPIRECEFWIGPNVRPEYPSGARLARIDFPLSLSIDSPVTIMGVVYKIRSTGVIITPDRAVLIYSLT
jgi:hypothetical protein